MKKYIITFLVGLIIGMGLMGFLAWKGTPGMMLAVEKSKLGFESTVMAVQESAEAKGWNVPQVYDIQQNARSAGHPNMTRLKILSLCQPDHAYNILSENDENKRISAIMPCRIGVYETRDGVYIAQARIGLIGSFFGGTVSSEMRKISGELKEILKVIID